MAKTSYRLQDLVESATDASLWAKSSARCVSCRKKVKSHAFPTTLGAVCAACVEAELKKSVRTVALQEWPLGKVRQALALDSADDDLKDRLTVLWRSHDVLQHHSAEDLGEVKKLLIRNMGFVQDHPLAQCVRQAAFRACVSIGKSLAPLLLELCAKKPWQFYANIIMTLGSVAPDDPEVCRLIEQAALDDNPEIRNRAQSVVLRVKHPEEHDETRKQIEMLMDSLDPSVRKLVRVGVEEKSAPPNTSAPKAGSLSALEQTLTELINKHYTVEALKRLYATYLHDYLFSVADFTMRGGFSVSKIKKKDLLRVFAKVFASKERFLAFFYKLPKEAQEIFQNLVWEGGEFEAKQLEKRYHTEIVKTGRRYGYGNTQDLDTPYVIFQSRSQYDWRSYREYSYTFYLSVSDVLRPYFKRYLPAPEGYELAPAQPGETAFLREDKDEILGRLKLYGTFIEQGNLAFSKSTGKLLKRSLTQMAKYCRIEEFYGSGARELEFLKTRLVIDFLLGRKLPLGQEPLLLLRDLFLEFFTQNPGKGQKRLYEFLYHLKGGSHDYNVESREMRVKADLLNLLKALSPGEWYSADALQKYCFYRDLSLLPIAPNYYSKDLYFNQAYKRSNYGGYERVNVRPDNCRDVVVAPFLKTAFFLLASFGLADVAYDWPENSAYQERDKAYLSPFDGLRYVRLTPLGAYAIGLQESYDASVQEDSANVLLDEKRLILTLEGRDPLKQMVLEKMAEKISDTCYKMNYQSFLKECSTKQDIRQKIKMFTDLLADTPPPVWQEFLQDVQNKINPLVKASKFTAFSLQENQDLIALFARDEVLKKHTLKAEAFHVLIERKNIPKVKKRLEEFGYFIDNI